MKCYNLIGKALLLSLLLVLPVQAEMTFDEARHLLARSGFGGTYADIQALTKEDYEKAVDKMVFAENTGHRITPPEWTKDAPARFSGGKKDREGKKAFNKHRRQQWMELKEWWYREMIATKNPLQERMTLFWHNHFTSSLKKVKIPQLIYRQNELLREHAKGNFQKLLHAVAKDPAMVIYLDSRSNKKSQPNENFAREVLELFTLGEGHYTESDIKNAARAFTGWSVNRKGTFRFNRKQHDDGVKHFMDKTGKFNGEDILQIVLRNPQVAIYLTEKLWKEFISTPANDKEVKRIALVLIKNKYEIKPWLAAMLKSPYFKAKENRGTMIKSPVELLVGTARLFGLPMDNSGRLAKAGRRLGQDIFDPPNVKGWEGGASWITSDTLLSRQLFLGQIMRNQNLKMDNSMGSMMSPNLGRTPSLVQKTLLAIPAVDSDDTEINIATALPAWVMDPAYQLK